MPHAGPDDPRASEFGATRVVRWSHAQEAVRCPDGHRLFWDSGARAAISRE